MSTDSHTQTIRNIRAELAQVDGQLAALKPLVKRRCLLRERLLSEVGAMIAEASRIDPGESMYRARENWGVSDA